MLVEISEKSRDAFESESQVHHMMLVKWISSPSDEILVKANPKFRQWENSRSQLWEVNALMTCTTWNCCHCCDCVWCVKSLWLCNFDAVIYMYNYIWNDLVVIIYENVVFPNRYFLNPSLTKSLTYVLSFPSPSC